MINRPIFLSLCAATLIYVPDAGARPFAKIIQSDRTSLVTYISNEDISKQAISLVDKITKEGIGFIENKEISEEKRKEAFKKILDKNFDMKTIARTSLGRFWRSSTKKQKKEYLELFNNMIVDVYSRRFSDYNGEKFEVLSAMPMGESDSLVFSRIITNSGAPIKIEWRVRKKGNSYKIIDIIVAGVSMSVTQRSDFASVIQRGGGNVDALLKHLRK